MAETFSHFRFLPDFKIAADVEDSTSAPTGSCCRCTYLATIFYIGELQDLRDGNQGLKSLISKDVFPQFRNAIKRPCFVQDLLSQEPKCIIQSSFLVIHRFPEQVCCSLPLGLSPFTVLAFFTRQPACIGPYLCFSEPPHGSSERRKVANAAASLCSTRFSPLLSNILIRFIVQHCDSSHFVPPFVVHFFK